ncbi:MAG: NAD(P)-dependent oxidoreductase [Kiritimatiellae bacterium]|nr:NAD(P)-dependent oxidoreductase [Kiritimatiellia bacterium]
MALHVLDEAKMCLGCPKPRCQQGCPIGTDIPSVIKLLKAGKLDEAGQKLFENNPLTTVCSLVCNHEKQCEGNCVRGIKGTPVHFSVIENYISRTYAYKMTRGPAPQNGMKAAIIGSGPAGLTIAVELARKGYAITIFEARDKIGGMMRYGIPDFRLPDSVLDDFQYRHLELKGVKVRTNTVIGKSISLDDLFRDGYKAVFIGAGLWKARTLHIKGESLGNAVFGIDYLANPTAFRLGDNIAVIGAGNSAMDCARTAIRNGARHVTCYARRDEISASEHEVSYAQLEGVALVKCRVPVEIRENGVIFCENARKEDGSWAAVPGSEMLHPHTGVIISVSQGPEENVANGSEKKIETTAKGLLEIDENGATSRPGVYAGGDAVLGARTVVEAVAIAKRVAGAMDAYMQSLPVDTASDPYANLPVYDTTASDALAR